jgi:blue copper oxidase
MAGMMSRMMGGDPGTPVSVTEDDRFEVMSFTVDVNKTGSVQRLPTLLAGAPSVPDWGEPIIQRQFDLQMHVGGGGMRSMMGQGDITGLMGINGQSMDMSRVDTRAKVGQTELWKISSSEMAHPFHVHGTHFQVLSQNGQAVDFSETGLKDVVLVDGEADIVVRFSRTANDNAPYMYHCHILEHEDAGMMGQLTVS